MDGLKELAAALDRFTLAYQERSRVDRDRLVFEETRDKRMQSQAAATQALAEAREARMARKEEQAGKRGR